MIEAKVHHLERELSDLKRQVRDLQGILNELVEKQTMSNAFGSHAEEGKTKYLMEVNEQMFQQNKRLREMIESCIETNTIPTHEQYARALKGN